MYAKQRVFPQQPGIRVFPQQPGPRLYAQQQPGPRVSTQVPKKEETKKEEKTDAKTPEFELKISKYMPDIMQAIKSTDIVIVVAPTGTGKSLEIPAQCAEWIREVIKETKEKPINLTVIGTVPTRVAVNSLVKIQKMRPKMADYKIGSAANSLIQYDSETELVYSTTGHLNQKILHKLKMKKIIDFFKVLMLDEAHLRTMDTELLFKYVRYVKKKQQTKFKTIISSATMDIPAIQGQFPNAKTVVVEQKNLHVDIIYIGKDYNSVLDSKVKNADMVCVLALLNGVDPQVVAGKATFNVQALCARLKQLKKRSGDVLVFQPGEGEICNFIEKAEKLRMSGAYYVPGYSGLPDEDLDMIIQKTPDGKQKIVVATNICESSVTVENVAFILDGMDEKLEYEPPSGVNTLKCVPISQSSADQRKGRTGRTCPGICVRMCSEANFARRPMSSPGEMDRVTLTAPILAIFDAGIDPYEMFEGIDADRLTGEISALRRRGLIETRTNTTPRGSCTSETIVLEAGKFIRLLPISVKTGHFMYTAMKNTAAKYWYGIEILAAMMESSMPPFYLPKKGWNEDKRQYQAKIDDIVDEFHEPMRGNCDLETMLKIFFAMEKAKNANPSSPTATGTVVGGGGASVKKATVPKGYKEWAAENHMNNKMLREARNIVKRLTEACAGMSLKIIYEHFDVVDIVKTVQPFFIECYKDSMFTLVTIDDWGNPIYTNHSKNGYQMDRFRSFNKLSNSPPKCLVAHSVRETPTDRGMKYYLANVTVGPTPPAPPKREKKERPERKSSPVSDVTSDRSSESGMSDRSGRSDVSDALSVTDLELERTSSDVDAFF